MKKMTDLIKPDAEFGKALIDAAVEKTRQEWSNTLIDEVRSMMTLADEQEKLAGSLTKSAAALRRRLQAIEKGKFSIDGKKVTYLDDEHENIIYRDSMEFIARNIPNWTPKGK